MKKVSLTHTTASDASSIESDWMSHVSGLSHRASPSIRCRCASSCLSDASTGTGTSWSSMTHIPVSYASAFSCSCFPLCVFIGESSRQHSIMPPPTPIPRATATDIDIGGVYIIMEHIWLSDAYKRTDVYNKNWTRLDHMTGDLHPHGQNSPDIPMSSIQNFFTLRFHFRRDIGMAGAETNHVSLSLVIKCFTHLSWRLSHERANIPGNTGLCDSAA